MHRCMSIFKGWEGVSKPEYSIAFECTENNCPGMLRGDQRGSGNDVEIAKPPGLLLYVFDSVLLSLAFDVADVEAPAFTLPFEHNDCTALSLQIFQGSQLGQSSVSVGGCQATSGRGHASG